MSQRRTKKAKREAHQRRVASLEYQLEHDDNQLSPQDDEGGASQLLAYSKRLIKQDLFRTAWATGLVFMILVALYFKL